MKQPMSSSSAASLTMLRSLSCTLVDRNTYTVFACVSSLEQPRFPNLLHRRSGIPEDVKEKIISSSTRDWESGLSYTRFFRVVLDAWASQLSLHRHRAVMKLIQNTPEEAG